MVVMVRLVLVQVALSYLTQKVRAFWLIRVVVGALVVGAWR